MTAIEIISLILNVLLVGGGLVTIVTLKSTRRKAKAEARTVEIENEKNLSQTLIDMIVTPLKKELNGLRRDVRRLQKAIDKINDCPHADTCPVRNELQNSAAADDDNDQGRDT